MQKFPFLKPQVPDWECQAQMASLLGQKTTAVVATAGCCMFGFDQRPIREQADYGKRVALAIYMLRMFSDTNGAKTTVPLQRLLLARANAVRDYALTEGLTDPTIFIKCESYYIPLNAFMCCSVCFTGSVACPHCIVSSVLATLTSLALFGVPAICSYPGLFSSIIYGALGVCHVFLGVRVVNLASAHATFG